MMTSLNKTATKCKIVVLDNLDSFTYNLVDEFQCLGFDPVVYRNTLSAEFIVEQIEKLNENCDEQVLIVLSPGPGDPSHAGCLMALIDKIICRYPILGICLGHQALIQHYGGSIGRAPEIVHGKSSAIIHTTAGAFAGINSPLPVARYHSLVATKMPAQLETIAYYSMANESDNMQIKENEKLVMAIEHQQDGVLGFQFHPESILTTYGSTLLSQSIEHLINKSALLNKGKKHAQ